MAELPEEQEVTIQAVTVMDRSESIGKLAGALAKAQGIIQGSKKDAENPYFKSDYSTLAAVWEACRDALSKNEVSVIQRPVEGTGVTLETILAHSSGEWISGKVTMPTAKNDAHAYGSALTYARRYSLASMVGVATVDDDGNAATDSVKKKGEKKVQDSTAADEMARRAKIVKDLPKDEQDLLKQLGYKTINAAYDRIEESKAEEGTLMDSLMRQHAGSK